MTDEKTKLSVPVPATLLPQPEDTQDELAQPEPPPRPIHVNPGSYRPEPQPFVTVNPGPRVATEPLLPPELLEQVRVNPASPRWDDPVEPPAGDDLDDADELNDADEG
jgi:hypothetical protein